MSVDNNRWTHSNTTIYNLGYHIIWCPKYRRKVLTTDVANRLKTLLINKAIELNCDIETMEVMPDHVHIFIKTKPTLAPHYIVRQLKGYTSRILRKEFPELKSKLPTLWTRSYYVESVGHISENTVKKYIEDQKNQ
jgi:putative transposase